MGAEAGAGARNLPNSKSNQVLSQPNSYIHPCIEPVIDDIKNRVSGLRVTDDCPSGFLDEEEGLDMIVIPPRLHITHALAYSSLRAHIIAAVTERTAGKSDQFKNAEQTTAVGKIANLDESILVARSLAS